MRQTERVAQLQLLHQRIGIRALVGLAVELPDCVADRVQAKQTEAEAHWPLW